MWYSRLLLFHYLREHRERVVIKLRDHWHFRDEARRYMRRGFLVFNPSLKFAVFLAVDLSTNLG